MYVLYSEYMAGSIVADALLRETGANYEARYVNMGAGQHLDDAYRRLNPAARVPALTLPDGSTNGETGAIVTHLGEAFPAAGLTPLPGNPDRPAFLFWLNVMVSTGYPAVSREARPEQFARSEAAMAEVRE
ncbi:glutathione S-transferase N-terminal domain-containing protein [Vannielia litorea]|uniref:glutathione S-transferase N-terminal domain-containing protein n=1 Tax=Vannielia litorea TaxID=1217970 RepID=UPI001BCFE43F|nr:glutathione S-transferase N-terminal domain-containing protein [Vannielia litorea]